MINVIIVLMGILTVGGFASYTYIEKLGTEKELLISNQSKLNSAIKEQQALIDLRKKNQEKISIANDKLRKEISSLTSEKKKLTSKLTKYEIDILAERHPKLVQNNINKASVDIMRCFEIMSGSPLTTEERSADRKSETNSQCTSLANPNYRGK